MVGQRETLGDPGRHELLRGLERLDDLQSLARCGRAKRVDHAERRKVEGNAAFKARDFDGAILAYLDAIWLLRPAPEPDDMPLASGCVPRGDLAAGLLGPKGEAATMGLGEAALDGRAAALVRSLHGNLANAALATSSSPSTTRTRAATPSRRRRP